MANKARTVYWAIDQCKAVYVLLRELGYVTAQIGVFPPDGPAQAEVMRLMRAVSSLRSELEQAFEAPERKADLKEKAAQQGRLFGGSESSAEGGESQ